MDLAFSLVPISSTVLTKARLSVMILPNSGKCQPYLERRHYMDNNVTISRRTRENAVLSCMSKYCIITNGFQSMLTHHNVDHSIDT